MRELLQFQKVLLEEKYEEYKMNFEGMYHGNGLLDSAQIWNWKCPTPSGFALKNLCVSVQGVSSYRCGKVGIFFTCTRIKYTLVCHVPWVSWATWLTAVCLDLLVLSVRVHMHVTNNPAQINWTISIQGICMVLWASHCVFFALLCYHVQGYTDPLLCCSLSLQDIC